MNTTVGVHAHYPPEIQEWIQGLGWTEEEIAIASIGWEREILPDGFVDGPDGQWWALHKVGPHLTITCTSGEKQASQRFVQVEGEYKPVEEGE